MQPPMNNNRRELIIKAFRKLDKTGDNVITVDDLEGVYSCKHHKKYLSGEWSEDECLGEFLKSFDTPNDPDGQVIKLNCFLIIFPSCCSYIFEQVRIIIESYIIHSSKLCITVDTSLSELI